MAYDFDPPLTIGPDGSVFVRSMPGGISNSQWPQIRELLGLQEGQRANADLLVRVLKLTGAPDDDGSATPTPRLSDQQWRELQKQSHLPDECRAQIDYWIVLLRAFAVAEEAHAFKARTKLMRTAAEGARTLARQVRQFSQSNVVNYPPDREGLLSVQLEGYAEYIEARLKNVRPGPKNDGKAFVVRQLNFLLLEWTDRGINRANRQADGYSSADFIANIFEIAGCSKQTAETLVKEVVDEMRYWAPEFRPNDFRPEADFSDASRSYWFFRS